MSGQNDVMIEQFQCSKLALVTGLVIVKKY